MSVSPVFLFVLVLTIVIIALIYAFKEPSPNTLPKQPDPPKPPEQPNPPPPAEPVIISTTEGVCPPNTYIALGIRTGRINPILQHNPATFKVMQEYIPSMETVEYEIPSEEWLYAAIRDEVRNRAVYIIGKTGTGKSTLAQFMAYQDILRRKGLAFIDPHGKHARYLLDCVPNLRVNEVTYFEPKHYPLPIDLLDAVDEDEANELASDVIIMFKRLTQDFGQQMDTILKFAIHTLVRARRHMPVTFMDLETLLTHDDFLQKALTYVDHEAIRHFWEHEYPAFKRKDSTLAIIRRMTDFRLSSVLPPIFGQTGGNNLDIQRIMDEGKVLLVNLGNVLPDDARIIGTFLITKIHLLLPRRTNLKPFYLYVDELDEFAASPFQKIITKCRKFEICLTLMNQGFYQIGDEQNRKAIKSIDTKVIFRIDGDDARLLKDDIAPFDSQLATTLPVPPQIPMAFYRSPISGTHLITPDRAKSPQELHHSFCGDHPQVTCGHADQILRNMRDPRVIPTCDTPPVCSTKGDDNSPPPCDQINPSGPPNVPSHGGEKKNT